MASFRPGGIRLHLGAHAPGHRWRLSSKTREILRAAIVEELRGAAWVVVQTAEDAIAYAYADHIFDVVVTNWQANVAEQVRGFYAEATPHLASADQPRGG